MADGHWHGDARADALCVAVVAPDPLVRAGLVSLLEGAGGVRVVSSAAPEAAAGDAGEHGAEVLLWDADPELDAAAIAAAELPVVALVSEGESASLLGRAGGVLYRSASPARLAAALHAVAAGLRVLEPELSPGLSEPSAPPEALTPRELEVLEQLSAGLANKAIAKRLGVSESTVKFHVNTLLSKFGAHNRTELAVRALQLGRVSL